MSKKKLPAVQEVLEQLPIASTAVYASLLRRCSSSSSLADGRCVHAHIAKSGHLQQSIHLGNLLIQMYRKCGNRISDARGVFDVMPRKDVVSWSSMIAAYAQTGHLHEALELYKRMDLQPNETAFVSSLAACSGVRDLALGESIHSRINGCLELLKSVFVGTAIVNMYAKCGALQKAREVFEEMQHKDVVAWTTMVSAYAQNGYSTEAVDIFQRMQSAHVRPNSVTLMAVLGACSGKDSLSNGQEIHKYIISRGLDKDLQVQNALLAMYAKCGEPDEALIVFNSMDIRDTVSWNSTINALAQNGRFLDAVVLFHNMNLEGIKPDNVTFLGLLAACSGLGCLKTCKLVHSQVDSARFHLDLSVKNSLLAAYAKCGDLETAGCLFDKITGKNVVSWTAMLTAYTYHGDGAKALELYRRMVASSVAPDSVALLNVVYACSLLGNIHEARKLQLEITSQKPDIHILNAMIHMYSRCGSIEDARAVFDSIKMKNIVSWNVIMGCYLQHGQEREVIELYRRMDAEIEPDGIMSVVLFTAYAGLGKLAEGRVLHERVKLSNPDVFKTNIVVGNALVSMYARCGALAQARMFFLAMKVRDTISWSSLISGYAYHGHSRAAIELYERMHLDGMQPDKVTYVSILNACSHGGLLEQGRMLFRSMVQDHYLDPWCDHYKCMIDGLGRAGFVPSAEELIHSMPFQPDFVAWHTLLGSCKLHGDVERGARAAANAAKLNPKYTGSHILLSNIVAGASQDEIGSMNYEEP